MFVRFLRRVWRDWLAATEGNKGHLAGVKAETGEAFLASFGRRPLAFFPEALRRLEWHAAQAHRIFLVTGTLEPLARAAARQLPVSVIACATELEVMDGRWTGRARESAIGGTMHGEALCGPAKARALERLAAEYRLDLARSYAYGDTWADHWMLERVGHPAAVNPSRRLARLACKRGWPVLLWGNTTSPKERPDVERTERSEECAAAMGSSSNFGAIWRSQ